MPSYKASDFIEKIPGTGGIIDTIAKRVGCNWHTAKRYVTEYATVKTAYDDEVEKVADMAVAVLLQSIKDGDVATAKWYLSKKRRGDFGETLDVNNEGAVEIVVRYADGRRNDTDSA